MIRRKIVNGPAPERGGGLLHLAVELHQHRLDRAHDERQRHEQQREQRRRCACRRRDAERARGPVERQQREAGDDRRQGEGQVDDRVDDALAAESGRAPGPRR